MVSLTVGSGVKLLLRSVVHFSLTWPKVDDITGFLFKGGVHVILFLELGEEEDITGCTGKTMVLGRFDKPEK